LNSICILTADAKGGEGASLPLPSASIPERRGSGLNRPAKDLVIAAPQSDFPSGAEIVLGRFSAAERALLKQDETALSALSALSVFSPALTRALAARPEPARRLFLDRTFEKRSEHKDLKTALREKLGRPGDLAGLQTGLRLFRLEELVRLAVRDLTGRADLTEVMATLTDMAELCLAAALEEALRFTAERFNLPPDGLGLSPIIIGMGKLGGRELNYSSDVDLIYLYRPGGSSPGAPPPEQLADAVFSTVTRAMSEPTQDGLVFRVDLDLRPGGKDGAQAQSLETARKHYLFWGQPWERMAFLKAHPIAGDLEAGRWFLSELSPFVFRRHLDYTAIEELKALKAKMTRDKKAKLVRLSGPGRARPALDVKLSPGGIREIEFFVQALILTFGGRLPHLRRADTLGALETLAREKIVDRDDAAELSEAYVFLRTVEHRLQLYELTQTQTLPKTAEGRERLARSMGFSIRPWPELDQTLELHMDRVRTRFKKLLAEPGEGESPRGDSSAVRAPEWVFRLLETLDDEAGSVDMLSGLGFMNPEAARAACLKIREERFLPDRLARYRRQMDRLLPVMIAGAAAAPDPDRAVLHLERFLDSIGPKAGFFILLEENPRLINVLSTLFGSSDYLSNVLINHPGILDSLIDRRSAQLVKDRSTFTADLDAVLGAQEDFELRLGVIRRFKNEETLRIGLYDLLGELTLNQVRDQLTTLAEVVMARSLDLAAESVFKGRRPEAPLPLSVMALGKLGGQEMFYGSDLDLIFIFGQARGALDLGLETAVRLAQRFSSYLYLPLAEGPGYQIDPRLRPSGSRGPLVVTPASFARYHRTSQLWERQALLKMRRVLGPVDLGAKIRAAASRAVFHRPLPEDAAERIDELRQRMTQERGRLQGDAINLKFSPGGLIDVEFITQYLQMVHGRRNKGAVRAVSTSSALKGLIKKGLGPRGLAELPAAHELISRVANRLSLIYARSGDAAAFIAEEIGSLNLAVVGPDPFIALQEAMETVSKIYAEVFGRKVGHAR